MKLNIIFNSTEIMTIKQKGIFKTIKNEEKSEKKEKLINYRYRQKHIHIIFSLFMDFGISNS